MDNHEYNIYVEIAYQIFQKCFEIENIKEERGWTAELSEALEAAFPGNHMDKKKLGDLYGRINRFRNENDTFLEISISEKTLDLLARFALIDDYKVFNRSFRGITVLYAPKPFKLFDVLRIPLDGALYKSDGEWIFKSGAEVIVKNKKVVNAVTYCMPGDHLPFWVKITYKSENNEDTMAYFSQVAPGDENINFLKPEKLLAFFKKLV
jgi:hypothetical protein